MKAFVNLACIVALVLIWFPTDWIKATGAPLPVQVDELSVLVIEEKTGNRSQLVQSLPFAFSQVAPGRWRMLDDDYQAEDITALEPWVQQAYQLPRESVPWLVAVDQDTLKSVPLPGTIEQVNAVIAEVRQ